MSFRRIALLPVALAALFVAVALAAGAAALPTVLAAGNELGKAAAVAGCLAAAFAFDRGDYLRRAWLYNGACYLLLLANDATGTPAISSAIGRADVLGGALVVIANASSVIGTFMLARAWNVAGLVESGVPSRRIVPLVAAALLSLSVTGWPLLRDARALLGGDVGASISIASDLGDTLCLALVAPVAQTAYAVRGGLLRWPWSLLAASLVAWVIYDATSGIIEWGHVESPHFLIVSEALRALGCATMLAAGLAQRKALADDAAASSAMR